MPDTIRAANNMIASLQTSTSLCANRSAKPRARSGPSAEWLANRWRLG